MNTSKKKLFLWQIPRICIATFFECLWFCSKHAHVEIKDSIHAWKKESKKYLQKCKEGRITRGQCAGDLLGEFMDLIVEGFVFSLLGIVFMPLIIVPLKAIAVYQQTESHLLKNS